MMIAAVVAVIGGVILVTRVGYARARKNLLQRAVDFLLEDLDRVRSERPAFSEEWMKEIFRGEQGIVFTVMTRKSDGVRNYEFRVANETFRANKSLPNPAFDQLEKLYLAILDRQLELPPAS